MAIFVLEVENHNPVQSSHTRNQWLAMLGKVLIHIVETAFRYLA